ncbi:MAG: DUF1553 domain-containing protein [Acidimicrobiia bacterium]|nr:DUF1553 domain-containing protein [Acidimicrobiia bacterium]
MTSGEEAAHLLSLRLVPEEVKLWGAKASQHFVVLGKYADGLERDVTSPSQFSISDPRVARVEAVGRVMALAEGKAVLKAELAGHAAKATVRTAETRQERAFSFARDIEGIFARRGCNSSGCHGGVKGMGGFKLSLDGLLPREDYRWIVEGGTYQVRSIEPLGPKNPRVNLKTPEQSLLLLKPTFTVPHGGGERFKSDSVDYRRILNWVKQGTPYGEDKEKNPIRVERIEVFPRETVLNLKGKHQLLVTAHLSNGRREDITDQVRYESLNPEAVKVSSEGLLEAARPGEAAIMIRSVGQVTDIRIGVVDKPILSYPKVARHNFIDEHIFGKLQRFHIIPSELSKDEEFLRRVCLDITGTLPPPDRVKEFAASRDPQKREKLIDILLNSPEYSEYWTFYFSDLFRVKGSGGWLGLYWEWVRQSIAQNKPYDQMARESIAAEGFDGPSRIYLIDDGKPVPLERQVSEKFRLFMGRRMDCAQCHDHPYDHWTQDQFWGIAAFFSRSTNTEWGMPGVLFDDVNGTEVDYAAMGNTSLKFVKAIQPRTRQEAVPRFLNGWVLPDAANKNLRLELARWMTSHPYFAEATVNRIWGHFFGRGFVNPVDDFRLGNPPTHPELLQALSRDFQEHGYDLKHLIRRIVGSRTYQLSNRSNATNRDDLINYSHALPRPLEAEVLLDAISQVAGVPEVFAGKDPLTGAAPPGTRAIQLKLPLSYPSRFLDVYGMPMRDSIPERDGKASLTQALHMLVGSTYTRKFSQEGGRLDRLLKRGPSDREIIEEFYLAALARFPTEEERVGLEELIRQQSSRRQAIEDLVWALISSREFVENH